MEMTATAAGQYYGVTNISSHLNLNAGIAVGDEIQFAVEFEIPEDSDPDYSCILVIYLTANDASNNLLNSVYSFNPDATLSTGPRMVGISGTGITKKMIIPENTAYLTTMYRFYTRDFGGVWTGRIGRHGFINHSKL